MRAFTAEPGYTDDVGAVRDFLVRINADQVRTPGFLWARWEWAITHTLWDVDAQDRIGVWEDDAGVIGLVTYETGPGEAWLVVDPARRDLLPQMVDHALQRLAVDGSLRVMVPDDDAELVALVAARGLERTSRGEPNMVLDLAGDLTYPLPDGFRVLSLAEEWDLRAFHRLMHRGFDHPGEPDWSPEELDWRRRSTSSPGQVPELEVLVRAPDGQYAAFCGTWLWQGSRYAMVEPVCADPTFRGLGCARAAVLDAVRRCRDRGAQTAYVGSSQEFYVRLGFRPAPGGTWWASA
jgi:GNAT superfamily N-acetyltransferase